MLHVANQVTSQVFHTPRDHLLIHQKWKSKQQFFHNMVTCSELGTDCPENFRTENNLVKVCVSPFTDVSLTSHKPLLSPLFEHSPQRILGTKLNLSMQRLSSSLTISMGDLQRQVSREKCHQFGRHKCLKENIPVECTETHNI